MDLFHDEGKNFRFQDGDGSTEGLRLEISNVIVTTLVNLGDKTLFSTLHPDVCVHDEEPCHNTEIEHQETTTALEQHDTSTSSNADTSVEHPESNANPKSMSTEVNGLIAISDSH